MNRIVVERQVNGEGVLELTLPLSASEAGQYVRVTIEPVRPDFANPAEWPPWVESMAGSWMGTFERPPQGDPEIRVPWS